MSKAGGSSLQASAFCFSYTEPIVGFIGLLLCLKQLLYPLFAFFLRVFKPRHVLKLAPTHFLKHFLFFLSVLLLSVIVSSTCKHASM